MVSPRLPVMVLTLAVAVRCVCAINPFPLAVGIDIGDWVPTSQYKNLRAYRDAAQVMREAERRLQTLTQVVHSLGNATTGLPALKQQAETDLAAAQTKFLESLTESLDWAKVRKPPASIDWDVTSTRSIDTDATRSAVGTSLIRGETLADHGKAAERVASTVMALADRVVPYDFRANLATQSKDAMQSTLGKQDPENPIIATIVVAGVALHQRSRTLTSTTFRSESLRFAWNYMHGTTDPIPDPALRWDEFRNVWKDCAAKQTEAEKTDGGYKKLKRIHYVSQLYQGSGLVGLMHLTQRHVTSGGLGSNQTHFDVQAHERIIDLANRLGAITGTTRLSTQAARDALSQFQSAGSQFASGVHFDFIGLGYHPSLRSRSLTHSMMTFNQYDPASFESGDVSMRAGAASVSQAHKQDNMAAIVSATVESLASVVTGQQLLGPHTLLSVFDDYADATASKDGAPIGFGIHALDQYDVLRRITADEATPTVHDEDLEEYYLGEEL